MKKPAGLNRSHARVIMRWMSQLQTAIYKRSGGKIGGTFLRGAPVALLTTIGRKSGLERTTPLLYLRNGDDVIVVASQGGRDDHPLWLLNLQANPEASVQIGRDKSLRSARVASPDEKDQLWPKLVEMYQDFDDYQSWTDRDIPVVILEPR